MSATLAAKDSAMATLDSLLMLTCKEHPLFLFSERTLTPPPIPLQYPHLRPNSSCLQGCKLSEDCPLGCPSPHCRPELWAALGNGNPIRFGTYFLPFNKPLAPQLQCLTLASGDPPEAMSSFGTFLVCLGLGLGTESPGSLGSPCSFARFS